MTLISTRDRAETVETITDWLSRHLADASDVRVSDIATPAIGRSVEQLIFTARWTRDGEEQQQDLVVRLEPKPSYQVFPDTNFPEQFDILRSMSALPGLPVPKVFWFEDDASILGSRFYVMEKLPGRAAEQDSDWVLELSHEDHRTLFWNGLEAMASVHRLDPASLDFKGADVLDDFSGVIEKQIAYNRAFYEQVREGRRYPKTEATYDWLSANKPKTATLSVQWGDARLGNQLFDETLNCRAILDWETVQVGVAEADLAWWLFVDGRTCATRAADPPTDVAARMPSDAEVIEAYPAMLGRSITDMAYWRVFAAARIAPILMKLDILFREYGVGWPGGNIYEDRFESLIADCAQA
jgi:aminoglycoside phosphotransferase (APT) family kinase protein